MVLSFIKNYRGILIPARWTTCLLMLVRALIRFFKLGFLIPIFIVLTFFHKVSLFKILATLLTIWSASFNWIFPALFTKPLPFSLLVFSSFIHPPSASIGTIPSCGNSRNERFTTIQGGTNFHLIRH